MHFAQVSRCLEEFSCSFPGERCNGDYPALYDNCESGTLMLDENGNPIWPDEPMKLEIIKKVEKH
jgi:hypothetical protein